ncbi:MAG: hypothetical protein ACRD2G_13410 [Terriglobia bacterium]
MASPVETSAIPDINGISPQTVREQVDRIVRSKTFRNSPALQRLLNFVTAKALEGLSDQLKEYTIGYEVFGRKDGYDPKIDTVVRVEMHRLREKLKEYYETQGLDDPVRIEIPKGHYLTTFELKGPHAASPLVSQPLADSLPSAADQFRLQAAKRLRGLVSHWPVACAAAVALFLSGLIIGARWSRKANVSRKPSAMSLAAWPDSLVRDFWGAFLGNDPAPVVGYADAVFLIDQTNDLFRFRRGASDSRGAPVDPHLASQFASNPGLIARAGPLFYEDGYTGTGELESISILTRLFTQMGFEMAVKRCREVTISDLRQHNVILLGSSFQNEAVTQLPSAGDFVFDDPGRHRELWRGRIINLHPLPGEKPVYRTERDPFTRVVKADYGLITVQPGIATGRYIADLGGLDTTGTEGATGFITSNSGLEELSSRLKALGTKLETGHPPFFQALVKVRVDNGQDVLDTHLVAVHLIHSGNDAAPNSPR